MAPSPTGSPHVGLARTALFNWAFARHHGGTFVFRIEDTDHARNTEESYDGLIEVMQWLGLDWDEGPLKGGDFGPYRQSERTDIYTDVARAAARHPVHLRLLLHHRGGRRAAQGVRLQGDGLRRLLPRAHATSSVAGRSRPRAASRSSASGCPTARSPGTTWCAARSPSRPSSCPDFALCRANGEPLYTLVNPVDDALMEITHVLRGEDLLSSTPRQLALYEALTELGIAKAGPAVRAPALRHGRGQQEASQARPEGAPASPTATPGSCPRACSTTWPCSAGRSPRDRDVFTLEEMVAAFEIGDVNPNPARFDLKKAEAINAAHMRMLSVEEMTERVLPFLEAAGVLDPTVAAGPAAARPGDAAGGRADQQADRGRRRCSASCSSTRTPFDGRRRDRRGRPRRRTRGARRARRPARVVDRRDPGGAAGRAGRASCELKPRVAFGPVRVAVTGRQGLAAAVRVAGAARPRAQPRPPARALGREEQPVRRWPPPGYVHPAATGAAGRRSGRSSTT